MKKPHKARTKFIEYKCHITIHPEPQTLARALRSSADVRSIQWIQNYYIIIQEKVNEYVCLQLHAGVFKTDSFVFKGEKNHIFFSSKEISESIEEELLLFLIECLCTIFFLLSNINFTNALNVWMCELSW